MRPRLVLPTLLAASFALGQLTDPTVSLSINDSDSTVSLSIDDSDSTVSRSIDDSDSTVSLSIDDSGATELPSDSTTLALPDLPDTTLAIEGKAAGATVTIRAKGRHRRKEISSTVLSRKEANAVAATAQDPMRALPTLPGVTVASDLSARPIVRGGDQTETGVELDGVPLLMPYHFGSVFSVFHREAIEDFQVYTGVAPAKAEGALSGTVLARTRSAPLDSFVGGADLSLLRGSGWIGIPLVPQRAGLWLSGQSMWYDWTVKRTLDLAAIGGGVSDEEVEEYKASTTLPTNWDLQAGFSARLTDDLSLDLGGFLAKDRYQVKEALDVCFDNGREVPCPYENYRIVEDEWVPNGNCTYQTFRDGKFQTSTKPCPPNTPMRTVYDTLANVELANWLASSRLGWSPDPDLTVEGYGAFQKIVWDVEYPGERVYTLEDSANNRWKVERVYDSSRFDWRRTSLDLGLSARKRWSPEHETSAGVGIARGTEIAHTDLDRKLAQLILGTTGNPLEFLGYFTEEELVVLDGENSRYLTMHRLEDLDFVHNSSVSRERENLWTEHRWDLDQGTRLRAGVRLSRADGILEVPNPRIQIQHEVTPSDLLGVGFALHTQSEMPFEWRLSASEPLVSQKAWMGVVEWEHNFAPGWRGSVSAWGKLYKDLASSRIERYGKADSLARRQEIDNWLYSHMDEFAIDHQTFWDRFQMDMYWNEDDSLSHEEFSALYQHRSDSLHAERGRVFDSIVPDHVERDLEDWLRPRRLRYASTGEGWAAGFEASLRYQPTDIWSGWASAEWSMSRRKDREDGIWYPFGLERPWKLAWVNAVKIDRAWELSVRYTALGGNPYTPFKIWNDEYDEVDSPTDRDTTQPDTALWIGNRNSANFAPYQRLDLRLSRSGTFFGKPSVVYYEIWNALNEPNIILRDSESGQFRWISMNLPFPVIFMGFEVRF